MVICFEYLDCYFEECCFPCFEREGTVHKATLNPPIIPLVEATPEYNNVLKVCSCDGYDWHEWFLFGRGALARAETILTTGRISI